MSTFHQGFNTTLPDNGWSVSYKLQLIDSATNSSILPNVTTIQVKQILFSVKKVDQDHNSFKQQMKNLKVANNWSDSQRWSDSRGKGFGWKWWASPQGHREFPPKTIELLSNYRVSIDKKPNQATMRESFSLVQNMTFIGYTNVLPAH